jgi:hypothetical protein
VREKRPGDIVDRIRVSRQPHRRGVRKDDRLDPKAESVFGRMSLAGVIEPAQYDAGLLYAKIVGEYRAMIGAPSGISGSGRGADCWIASSGGGCLVADCPCRKKEARYARAYGALWDAGQPATKAVARVCVQGETIPREEIVHLKRGLSALVKHFGLTDERPSTHSRNAN